MPWPEKYTSEIKSEKCKQKIYGREEYYLLKQKDIKKLPYVEITQETHFQDKIINSAKTCEFIIK